MIATEIQIIKQETTFQTHSQESRKFWASNKWYVWRKTN